MKPFLQIVAAGILLAATGCGKKESFLKVTFTCDSRGRLEPCGCFDGQMGGLTRIYSMLGEHPASMEVRVDVGDALAGTEDYEIMKYKFMLEAFAKMGYAAMNVGRREAGMPLADLERFSRESPVPIIGANLVRRATEKPIFPPYKVVRVGNRSVGIIGVVDPELEDLETDPEVRVQPMEDVLPGLLNTLENKVDVVVLLAFASETRLHELADTFYECDLILGGAVAQPSQDLERKNKSMILYVTNQARSLGEIYMKLSDQADPEYVDHRIHLVHHHIPQAAPLLSLAHDYREEVRVTRLAVDDPNRVGENWIPGVPNEFRYAGSESCRECHEKAYAVWNKSGHAKAFRTLEKVKSDADPSCIRCHTIGFGRPGGYLRRYKDKQLTDVGCEGCHGPGARHVSEQKTDNVSFKFRPLAAGDCRKCHYGEFSRPFDWDEFWPPIKHGED